MKPKNFFKVMTVLFATLLAFLIMNNTQSQAVQAKSVNAIIDNIYLTHEDGGTESPWSRYEQAKITMDWSIPDHTVKAGDTASFTLPDILKLTKNLSFPLVDENSPAPDNVVAQVFVEQLSGVVTITFTDYAETHSYVHGAMWFMSGFNTYEMMGQNNFTLIFTDSDGVTFEQELEFKGTGENPDEVLFKYGSFADPDNPDNIHWYTRVNLAHETLPQAILTDRVGDYHELIPGSLIVYKVNYSIENNQVVIRNHVDVTANLAITQTNKGFTINFGDINGEGYLLSYDTRLSGTIPPGTYLENTVTLSAVDILPYTSSNTVRVSEGGGNGAGETGAITLLKKDSVTGSVLAGAKFDVIRQSDNSTIGTIITDENGRGSLTNLTFGSYQLVEIQAPSGYQLDVAPYTFTINVETPVLEILRENTPLPTMPETTVNNTTSENNLPVTGGYTAELIIGGVTTMVLSLGLLFIKRRDHQSSNTPSD